MECLLKIEERVHDIFEDVIFRQPSWSKKLDLSFKELKISHRVIASFYENVEEFLEMEDCYTIYALDQEALENETFHYLYDQIIGLKENEYLYLILINNYIKDKSLVYQRVLFKDDNKSNSDDE